MGGTSLEIGKSIRIYRNARQISLSQLAQAIHKTKSTMSKYENGEITIDVDTLSDIAAVLKVPPEQLFHAAAKTSSSPESGDISRVSCQYLYIFDGRNGKILRSLLKTTHYRDEEIPSGATLFYNVPSFDEYEKCRSLYFGIAREHEFAISYSLQNQTNSIESLYICAFRSLDVSGMHVGMMSGISSRPFLPISAKTIFSEMILKEDDELVRALTLSREDLRLIKRSNMFMIDQLT